MISQFMLLGSQLSLIAFLIFFVGVGGQSLFTLRDSDHSYLNRRGTEVEEHANLYGRGPGGRVIKRGVELTENSSDNTDVFPNPSRRPLNPHAAPWYPRGEGQSEEVPTKTPEGPIGHR